MSNDIGAFFIRLVKITLIMSLMLAAAIGIVHVMRLSTTRIKNIGCERNLRELGEAIAMYRQHNNNFFPPYLTALYPDYIDDESIFVCPADPNKGLQGAWPRWTRYKPDGTPQPDWRKELAYTDLDGPTMLPWEDEDTFPSSYYYRFNDYPKDNAESSKRQLPMTWQQYMLREARPEFGDRTPVASCYWHLPSYAKSSDEPLLNLLFDLHRVEVHPMNWQHHVLGLSVE